MPALKYASWPCDNLSNINPFGFACILKCPNKKPQNIADIWLSSRVKTQVYSRPPGKQIPFDTSLLTLKPKWWKKLAATRSLKTMKIAKARLAAHRGKGKCKNVKKHPRYIILRRVQNILEVESLFSGNGEKILRSVQFSIFNKSQMETLRSCPLPWEKGGSESEWWVHLYLPPSEAYFQKELFRRKYILGP